MKRYESYKPSGIEWIDILPKHWDSGSLIYNIKHIRTGLNPRDNFSLSTDASCYYVTIKNFKDGILYLDEKCDRINIDAWSLIQQRSNLKKGDVLFASIAQSGQAYILKDDPINWNINESVFSIRIDSRIFNSGYFYYLITNKSYFDYLHSDATGSTFTSIKQDMLKHSKVIIPPLHEQTVIAAYLDSKCAKIDNVMVVQQKRIELLKELKQSIITHAVTKGLDKNAKLKPSGVDWIGEVPEKWKIMKINYLVNAISDVNHYMPNDADYGYPYVMTGDLRNYASEIDFESCKQISETDYKDLSIKVKSEKGDVIFARYATIGTVCFVDVDKDFIVSYSCVTIKPKQKLLHGKYLYYYLKSQTFFEGISQSVNSNTQGNVGIESLSAEKIVVPTLEEQITIAAYLDKKCATIDKQISKIERQIELLKEYKQSVITECVTGKRKVC